jgi:transposase-like protein
LRGEESISELCRREGIAASMYYGWSKERASLFAVLGVGRSTAVPPGHQDLN